MNIYRLLNANKTGQARELSSLKGEKKEKNSFEDNLIEKINGNNVSNDRKEVKNKLESIKLFQDISRSCMVQVKKDIALQKTKLEGLSYIDCDKFEIAVTKGYTLKGKIAEESTKENPVVYVEIKQENGTQEAYKVDINQISKTNQTKLEEFAHLLYKEWKEKYER